MESALIFYWEEMVKIGQMRIKFTDNTVVLVFLLLTWFISNWSLPNDAAAKNEAQKHEVVFLLDVSNSMNETDPDKLAPDCLEEILYALPSNYAVGLVAYGSDVQAVKPLAAERAPIGAALRQVNYTGYTNAGAGLEKALTLFSSDGAADKTIILLSDGEIMLDNPAATQASQTQFNQAMETAAKQGVRVCAVAIGNLGGAAPANIYALADKQGRLLHVGDAGQLSDIGKKILYEELGIVRTAVSSGDLPGDLLSVRLPLKQVKWIDSAKILLTSTAPIANVGAGYMAGSGEILSGKRYAVVQLRQPQSETAQIHFGTAGGGNIQADLILEMNAAIQTEVQNAPFDQSEQKTVEVRLTPVSAANQNQRLLDDPYFEGKSVHVIADGVDMPAKVEKGSIRFSLAADATRTVPVKVRYTDLGVNIVAPDTTYVEINRPQGYGVIIATIAAIAVIAAALMRRRMKKPKPPPPQPPASRYEYAGKLKLYITKSPDGSDVAPLEYNLYRRFRKEEISLGAVLEQCGLPFALPGAYKISFAPGANKALVLSNKSDCTILRNRDLLVKDHSALVNFNERIHITFEDERSELILEYKNVKPSERR